MRQLSATLLAAQTQCLSAPVAEIVIDERHIGVFRPRWQQAAADTVADGPSAVGLGYDGAFIRLRSDPAAGRLYVQRVVDPRSAAQWTAWVLLESNLSPNAQIALAYDGAGIQAAFWVAADQRTIKMRQSSDNGQSWSAASTVATVAAGSVVRSLAATLNAGLGTLYCMFSSESAGAATIYSTYRAEAQPAGAWSTPLAWGRAAAGIAGLAVNGAGDRFDIVACLTSSNSQGSSSGQGSSLCVFAVTEAALGAWPDPLEVLHSDNPALSYGWPSIAISFDYHYHIFFVESKSVETNQSAGYTRLSHVITPNWSDISMFPRPYQMAASYGACAMSNLHDHFLCTSRYVYRASRWGRDAGQRLAVGSDIYALSAGEYLQRPGRLTLALRNDDGRYAAAGEQGPLVAIRPGSQVSLRLGYRSAAGNEVSYYRAYWITGLTRQRRAGRSRLLVSAVDGWGILESLRARQAYLWSGRTILAILSALLKGLGFALTDDGDPAWSRPLARFAITPGAGLGDTVRRLLALTGGSLIFRSNEEWEAGWPSAVAHLAVAPPAATYTYGVDHPIIAAEFGQGEPAWTHVLALGEGEVCGEALDWEAIELANEDRLHLSVDRRLATAADAAGRAAGELAACRRSAQSGFLLVPPNVGQEVFDGITVSDPAAGLDGAAYTIIASEITYDREKGIFEQRLELGE